MTSPFINAFGMCVHVHMCMAACVVEVGARGQYQVLSSVTFHIRFSDRVFHWGLGLTD